MPGAIVHERRGAGLDTVSGSRYRSLPDTRMSARVGGGRGCEPVAGAVAAYMFAGPSRRLGPPVRSLDKTLRVRGIPFVQRAFREAERPAALVARRARRQPVSMFSSAAVIGSGGDDPWR